MRKLAPVFVLTSIVALTSGSALALGDRNKEKKSPNADTTAIQGSTYSTPSSSSASGSAVSSVAKSNKEACKGLSKSDPAYAANQCDQLVKKGDKQASAGATSSSGSGK